MIVLGIDPGSFYTGYGVIRHYRNECGMLASGVIRLHRHKSYAERIGAIYRELEALIVTYRPSRIALETVFLSRNVQSALKLGQIRGAVIALAVNKGVEILEYAPREVKAAVTGRGAASKQQVSSMVRRILQIESQPETYDVTDALSIALCDILKTENGGLVPDQASRRKGTRSGKNDWAAFVRARPDMVVR